MKYDEIFKPLSRTSFASKMMYASFASADTMSHHGQVETKQLVTKILPIEIETIVLHSVMA